MSPGVNGGGSGAGAGGGPRNTGTLPKSNRRSDRNRERSAANQQLTNRSGYHGHPQHFNNLFHLDWQVASECEREPRVPREAKNSNTRSASSQLPSSYFTTYQDLSDFAHNSARQCNYSTEDCTPWLKMVPFTPPRTQSPSRLQGTKPSNVNKMPDRSQVESRLNQIRDYIKVTATMIDSLGQSSDPRAQAQSEKLSRMVDDLHDSETKLSKLLEQYVISDENGEREDMDECGDASREMQLRRNMEEYQNKLAQLQEQQASLADMQMCVRERLNKARQAQQMLLQQENQNAPNSATWEDNRAERQSLPSPANVEQLESETAALRGKLVQLQTKKKQMDHLVAELQAIETSDRGSCSSEGSRNTIKDKAAELEAMKAQLAHIKALMEDGTKIRDTLDSSSDAEPDIDAHDDGATDGITEDLTNISFEGRSNDVNNAKLRCFESNISDIRALTSELKEQSALLQTTRAELQRLKQPLFAANPAPSNCPFSRPPPALVPLSANEKKQSCNTDTQSKQTKRSQLEDLIRKETMQPSNMNRDVQALDQNSQKSSGSQASHSSTPGNIWPSSVAAGAGGSNEQSVDGISTSENLLDIGPPVAVDNGGVVGNLWAYPIPPPSINQGQNATVEYYRQLLLGSQAHQLQMMGTTMHQCCQLLWTQQRELQSMRAAITDLQLRSQNPGPQRVNNVESQEEHSNLSRSVHNLGDTLDAILPPSSSLPNLVSLPNSSAALSHTPIVSSSNPQQQQQQQQQQQIGVNISGNSTTEGGSQNSSEKPEKEKELRQLNMTQFQVPDLKPGGHMMDVRTADGSVVKISAGNEQDLAKTLGVEMVQNMYKVNVEDINQLLAYHEVFGKLQSEIAAGTTLVGSTVPTQTVTTIQNGTPIVQQVQLNKFDIKSSDGEATPGPSASPVSVGSHACEICGKIFQFRYQLIVHRRYHTERKPFTCQVCGKAFSNANDLTRHGKCHLGGSMFTCTVCFHVFANAPSLERHMKRHATDKPYNCTVCGKSFARKEHLDNHTRCHTGETPYRCQYCSKTFTRKEHMVNHVRKHTGETPHRCDICKKSFTRKEHFMNHVMWHTGETPHHCQACGKKYTRKEHLANHMRSHTNDTPFRCEICGKSFTRKEHFTNHIMWHTGETPHRCDFCSKTFTRKEHLLNHVRQHTGESPHRCGFCSKSFTRKEHLVNHIRQHTGETPFRCSYCPKAFTRKDHLVNHVRQHTGESPHKCQYCTKSFTRKEHLTNHVRQHTGESPHRCHFCSKSFTRKEHLTNHVRIHTGESPHRCEFCQRTFTRKEHLNNHLRQHTGDSSHCCNVCSKPFTRKEHLVNHMRCHTGERPFVCTECGKSFPLKGNLLFHMRSHNKGSNAERPFRCDLCPKDFMCKGHLVSHRRSHSDERPHSCPDCGKTFVEKGNMLRHLRKHAAEGPPTQVSTPSAIPQSGVLPIPAAAAVLVGHPLAPPAPPVVPQHTVVVPTPPGVLTSY